MKISIPIMNLTSTKLLASISSHNIRIRLDAKLRPKLTGTAHKGVQFTKVAFLAKP